MADTRQSAQALLPLPDPPAELFQKVAVWRSPPPHRNPPLWQSQSHAQAQFPPHVQPHGQQPQARPQGVTQVHPGSVAYSDSFGIGAGGGVNYSTSAAQTNSQSQSHNHGYGRGRGQGNGHGHGHHNSASHSQAQAHTQTQSHHQTWQAQQTSNEGYPHPPLSGRPPHPHTQQSQATYPNNTQANGLHVIEIRTAPNRASANTTATRVDSTWNSAGAPWHVVSGDRVLFCLEDEFVRES